MHGDDTLKLAKRNFTLANRLVVLQNFASINEFYIIRCLRYNFLVYEQKTHFYKWLEKEKHS
jgi:hypothetical protein